MAEEKPNALFGVTADQLKDLAGDVVGGGGNDITDAVKFVAQHGDDLIDLVGRLPELLSSTASALTEAADDVGAAAAFLTGGRNAGPGVQKLAEVASDALDTCRDELADAEALLRNVAGKFDRIPMVGDDIGEAMGDVAKRFDTVGDRLAQVAVQLRKLGGAVDSAGHGLSRTAAKLDTGGKALSGLGS
ncbi:MAG: hypothetical protein ACR2P0_05735 [Acidimicrobiales bacterium]